MQIELEWDGADGYAVETPSGAKLALSSGPGAASPMEALLAALAGCMAIDVVLILKRMRAAPKTLHARVSGERDDDHPRRFRSIRLEFTASGGAVVADRLERSVELSFEKYCSVLHSLAPDIRKDCSAHIESSGS